MNLADLRSFITAQFTNNGTGDIDGLELRTALLALCDRIEAEGSWQPVLALTLNGPYVVLKVTDWTGGQGIKPPVNVYAGASGYVTDINAAVNLRGPQGLQGLPGSGVVQAITQYGDGYGSPRYYPVCELPAPNGGTYDFAEIELVGKHWDASTAPPTIIRLTVANRGSSGLHWKWICIGPVSLDYGLCLFVQPDNRLIVYVSSDDFFRVISWRVTNHAQATVYASNLPAVPSGTAVMNTRNPSVFPPYAVMNSLFTTFTSANSDGSNPGIYPSIPGMASVSFGANLLGGATEFDFVNSSGFGSGGFAFWQQISATARRFLAYLTGAGFLGIGTPLPVQKLHVEGSAYLSQSLGVGVTAPTEKADIDGRVRSKGLVTTGALPAISKGAGVSTGSASLIANSTDMAGGITLTTAGTPTAGSVLCSVTFNAAYARAPRVLISANNVQAANAMTRIWASATAIGFTLNAGLVALDNAQSYEFTYLIIA